MEYDSAIFLRAAKREAVEFGRTVSAWFLICTVIVFGGLGAFAYFSDLDARWTALAFLVGHIVIVWQILNAVAHQFELRLAFMEQAVHSIAETVKRIDEEGVICERRR